MPPDPDPFALTPLFARRTPWALPVPQLTLDPQFQIPPYFFPPPGPSSLQLTTTTQRDQITNYLDGAKGRLQFMTLDEVVSEVKMFVAGASQMADNDVKAIIANYCFTHQIIGPFVNPLPSGPNSQPGAGGKKSDSELVEAVKKAVTSLIDGVPVITHIPAAPSRPSGTVKIGVSGATAELKKSSIAASVTIGWTGTMTVDASKGNLHVEGSLSSSRWEFKISYPEDTPIPDIGQLKQIFTQGESALRGVIKATGGISNLSDIPKVAANIKPYVQPLKDAVEAAQGAAKAKGGFSVGFSLNSPPAMPGQQGIPGGVQGVITFTVTFW